MSSSPAPQLRALLDAPGLRVMPCCFDALSARLIEQAGFELTFMSGFAVSASRLGMPDTGLISFGEMLDQGRNICSATRLPVIGDGDTGYGNAENVKRTVTVLRERRFRRRDDRGPGSAQAVRAHEGQARRLPCRGAVAGARRGGRTGRGRRHSGRGAHRRPRHRRIRRGRGPLPGLRGHRRGHPLLRGPAVGGRDDRAL